MMETVHSLSAKEISEKIASGELSREAVAAVFKERIKRIDPSLNSFVRAFDTSAEPKRGPVSTLADPGVVSPGNRRVDAPLSSQGSSALAGAPIAIKDNICIEGEDITCASRILSGHRAVYDATVIERIKGAGLQISGITNMDEFAFGSSTESSCYGPTKNPWDTTRVPGGSSGGSAAAVAARLVPLALGSDTGGSIRQPASCCGVVGFKPTYGRVSRYGLIAFGSSLDQIGPITTNFVDCALLLNIICGQDGRDSTSLPAPVEDYSSSLGADCQGLTIGLPREYFAEGLDQEVREAIEATIVSFKKKKIKFIEIRLPHTEYAVATYYLIGSSEASSNLQRFDGVKYGLRQPGKTMLELHSQTRGKGFGDEAKRRIFLGTYSLSSGYYDAYYLKALKVRRLIKQDFDTAFSRVDAILTPTAPTPAFKIGEKISDPLSMYLSDIYTISANLAGLPAVSFPCGFSKAGLPIGAQLIAKELNESTLISLGWLFEQGTDFHTRIPPLAGK